MRYSVIVLICIFLYNCHKTSVDKAEVLTSPTLTSSTMAADGVSLDTITVNVNNDSDPTKRNVLFTTTGGKFLSGTDTMISVKALYANGHIQASAVLVAAQTPGYVKVTVVPDLPNLQNDFSYTDSILYTSSQAAQIKLDPSAYGIKADFGSEVTITGVISNINGKPVSIGTHVLFADSVVGSANVHGNFRAVIDSTSVASTVSATYSIGSAITSGMQIYLKVTVLDSLRQPTPIVNSIKITVI